MIALIQKILIVSGSSIFLLLGSLHLYYTFFSDKFLPRNPGLASEMNNTSPRLTRGTTMWKAWIGFNASHSSGAMYIGLINIVLVIVDPGILIQSFALPMINILTVAFYIFLGKKYWFRIPLAGMVIAGFCFISSLLLSLLS